MQGNILGQSGSSNGLNIFAQPNEPNKKDGIWIKTPEKYKYEKVRFVDDFGLTSSQYKKLADLPSDFNTGSAVAIGTDIYLVGDRRYIYKYNAINNEYTKLTDIPSNCEAINVTKVGTNIYLLGGFSPYYDYKYDTLTDTYTKLSISQLIFYGATVAVGTDIYLFGGRHYVNGYEQHDYSYKYDTLTDTYTKLSDMPHSFYDGTAVAVGTDIYLFGGAQDFTSDASKNNYKYDTLTDTYTKLSDIPYVLCNGAAVAVGTDIYLLGGGTGPNVENLSGEQYKYNYKYDTLTDTYTKLSNIPHRFYKGAAVVIDTNIYLFGGSDYETDAYIYLNINTTNKTIVIEISGYLFKVLLNKKVEIYFSGAKIYDNGTLQDYQTYYGDGEQWNLLN